jgi:cell division cycle 20-like protein 1 (cofactor of APC complex)
MFGTSLENSNSLFFRKNSNTRWEDDHDLPLKKKNSGTEDRFIPSVVHKNIFDLYQKENSSNVGNRMDEESKQFDQFLKKSILNEDGRESSMSRSNSIQGRNQQKPSKLLHYNNYFSRPKDRMAMSPERPQEKRATVGQTRKIKDAPYKILDAPSLQDDFYFNIVDWSAQNYITIGLVNHVYSLNASTGKSFKLTSYYGDNLVSAISSNDSGSMMAVGTTGGKLDIFDFEKYTNIKTITGHSGRVGALAWKENIIASGSRDSFIMISDVRSRKPFEAKLEGHRQEICGLSFNSFDWQLASGGNDNKVMVWDAGRASEVMRMSEHIAAVKALSWSSHQNGLLATGGGSTDKTIKLWNVKTSSLVKSIDTGSQVCALRFSKSVNELVSTHGFSQNQIEVWRIPDMERVATLKGHTERVLYLDISPNGEDIVTASADETLRFWKVFPSFCQNSNFGESKFSIGSCMDLR